MTGAIFLPVVLPLTALPISHLAEQYLHPRAATRLLTSFGCVLAVCSTLCLGLLMVVGTAHLPGNPLPDGWADPQVRAVVPYPDLTGTTAIVALAAALTAALTTLHRHRRVRNRAHAALAGLGPGPGPAVLPDDEPYAYALPGPGGGRVVVSTGMLARLEGQEPRALFAHEHAHLRARHHRYLLAVRLAACANPLLLPLREAVAYAAERWADEEAAQTVGDRRLTARAVARAALVSRARTAPGIPHFAALVPTPDPTGGARPPGGLPAFAAGPVPRRVAALLGPVPSSRQWPPLASRGGVAAFLAAAGTTASAVASLNAAIALFFVLKAATTL